MMKWIYHVTHGTSFDKNAIRASHGYFENHEHAAKVVGQHYNDSMLEEFIETLEILEIVRHDGWMIEPLNVIGYDIVEAQKRNEKVKQQALDKLSEEEIRVLKSLGLD